MKGDDIIEICQVLSFLFHTVKCFNGVFLLYLGAFSISMKSRRIINMKKLLKSLFLLLFFICLSGTGFGQSSDAVQLDSCTFDNKEQTVRISIKTTESFIVGANRYVLHIGGNTFLRNIHPDGRLDEIVFLVPLADYESLQVEGEIVLVYGYYHENELQDNEGSQVNGFMGKHWKLGAFKPQNFTN